ncbi:MAG: hypothetical protein ACRDRL_00860 [Sciscionella sp.]
MRLGERWELAALCLVSALSATMELFYLPLRFDGTALPTLHGLPFPVTVLLAAVATPLLVRRCAALKPSIPVAGAPVLVWLVVVLGLGVTGPGGDSVLLPDWRTLALVGGAMLPSAVALGTALGSRGASTR